MGAPPGAMPILTIIEMIIPVQGLLPPSLLQGYYRTHCGAFVEQSTLEH